MNSTKKMDKMYLKRFEEDPNLIMAFPPLKDMTDEEKLHHKRKNQQMIANSLLQAIRERENIKEKAKEQEAKQTNQKVKEALEKNKKMDKNIKDDEKHRMNQLVSEWEQMVQVKEIQQAVKRSGPADPDTKNPIGSSVFKQKTVLPLSEVIGRFKKLENGRKSPNPLQEALQSHQKESQRCSSSGDSKLPRKELFTIKDQVQKELDTLLFKAKKDELKAAQRDQFENNSGVRSDVAPFAGKRKVTSQNNEGCSEVIWGQTVRPSFP